MCARSSAKRTSSCTAARRSPNSAIASGTGDDHRRARARSDLRPTRARAGVPPLRSPPPLMCLHAHDAAHVSGWRVEWTCFQRTFPRTLELYREAQKEAIAALPGSPWWIGPLLIGAGVLIRSAQAARPRPFSRPSSRSPSKSGPMMRALVLAGGGSGRGATRRRTFSRRCSRARRSRSPSRLYASAAWSRSTAACSATS